MKQKNQRRNFVTFLSSAFLSFFGLKKINGLINLTSNNSHHKISIYIHPKSVARKIKG